MLVGAELAVPGAFLIWLGLAALAPGIADLASTCPGRVSALLFSGLAVALVGIATRLHRRGAAAAGASLNRADRGLIGREGVLDEPIVQGAGHIRFDDTLWRVTGPDLPAGGRVRVTGISGTVLRVEAA